jgi:hypothetical protein
MFILFKIFRDLGVFLWDLSLTLINLVTPNRAVGKVTLEGHPGFGGKWPEYIPPKEGDSRCSCPGMNAMANHGKIHLYKNPVMNLNASLNQGILPRDGKNIPFKEMSKIIRATYNFSPTFGFFVTNFASDMLKRDYNKDTFDLVDLDLHNGIEHDASVCRKLITYLTRFGAQ